MFYSFRSKKEWGISVVLFSILQILVGGGLAPIFSGIIGGIAGMKINSEFTWWRKHSVGRTREFLKSSWIWFLAISLIWVPAEYVLGYVFGAGNSYLANLPNYPIPVVFFALTLVGAFAPELFRYILRPLTNQSVNAGQVLLRHLAVCE